MLDTIIIGAGFAGLAAARTLQQAGQHNFVLLEARDRVGGRTKHGHIAGLDIDLGGMWVSPSQTRLTALAEAYGVDSYPTFLDGKVVLRLGGKQHFGEREDIEGVFGWPERIRFLLTMHKLIKLTDSIDINQPWAHPQAEALDRQTLEQWVQANVGSERIKAAIRMICYSLLCAEASQVSMLFFAHYVASGDGIEKILSAEKEGAQARLFHGGVHQIARRIATDLGDKLCLNQPVLRIEWSAEQARVHTTDGQSYVARKLILTVPPTLLDKITFEPALPQARRALNSKLSMGSCIKYWVAYERPFWREQGFNGSVFRDDVACSPCFDVSPPGQPLGVIAGFFDGNHAVAHSDRGQEQRGELVLKMLAEHFGEQALQPVEYKDEDWTSSQWSGGCYGNYAPPGVYGSYGPLLRPTVGPIHWAGTETSPRWTGYIDGAIRSGERAAADVMESL